MIFKKIINRLLSSVVASPHSATPRIYTRSEHCISRAQINKNALKVLYRLDKLGYQSYLVGGCVRDLLLGREPKDFDVATDASPEQVKIAFRNCRLIGRRFRLAHVRFGSEIIEVATFRAAVADSDEDRVTENGRLLRDNVYGSIEEDAWRRDFSVNALYYNIKDFTVVDYVGGMTDHQAGSLRVIGDAQKRYTEDPVRMLRAVRFATKLGFSIAPDSQSPISRLAGLLNSIPPARLYEEVLKLFFSGYALQTYEQLRHYHLFEYLFPETEQHLTKESDGFPHLFVAQALKNTDLRLQEDKPVTPYFLLAALLWEPVRSLSESKMSQDESELVSLQAAAQEVISRQVQHTAFPRRVSVLMKEVWSLQSRFENRTGNRAARLLTHPRFRAGYDFLLLRAETGEVSHELVAWWTKFQSVSESEQRKMTTGQGSRRRKRKPRNRNRNQNPKSV